MTPESIAKRLDSRFWARIALAAAVTAGLGACQSRTLSDQSFDSISTASLSQPSIKETALAGKRWDADPGNASLGVAYARQLQALDQNEQALKVLSEVVRRNPGNVEIEIYYGKQLASNGRAADAERVLQAVANAGKADWKTHSVLGSALAQQGKYAEARQHYQTALSMRPGEISIYNNMGMAYMLEGKLDSAEQTLRQAMALPGGTDEPQLRQNLALALGLQGRFDEARDMASRDLPPDMVEANMAYLQRMLAQQNTWQQLKTPSPSGT
jgi:Flp pilus assembly protein TadD